MTARRNFLNWQRCEFDRLVGRSTYLAAALECLAEGHKRLTELAAASADGSVYLLDPACCRRGREARLDHSAVIDNVLLWLTPPKLRRGGRRPE